MKTIILFFVICIISTATAQQKDIFNIDFHTEKHKSKINPDGPNERFLGTLFIDSNLSKMLDSITLEERPDKTNWIAFSFHNIYTIISYNESTNKDSCEILSSPYIIKVIPGWLKEKYIIKSGEIRVNRKKGIIYYDKVIVILDIFKKS